MEWTTERRYRLYQDWTQEEIQHIKENMAQSPWHTHYHVEPKTGLLNDPNGFSYFDGKWIVFYQNFPFGAAHGLKSWVQLESDDLVHFTETEVKVLPDTPLDSHGAYSGSAMQFGDNLFLFYTGNVRDENWIRHPYQIGALMDKDGKITKIDKILIDQPADSTDHFRDPQIFNFKGQYYAIVGGQDLEKKGFVRLYKAIDNDYTNWQAVGNLDFANDRTAYMMECPNLVFVGEQPVLQAFNAPDGRALAVSWLGLPDVSYPSDRFDHQGTFSLVKELTIKDGKLYQYPVAAIKDLRATEEAFSNRAQTKNTYELELNLEANSQSEIVLLADKEGKGLSINFDLVNGQVTVDRSQAGEQYAQEFGTTRSCPIDNQATTATIFIDNSVFEIFINKGEKVFSGRVFPHANQNGILIKSGNPTGTYYELDYGRKTN